MSQADIILCLSLDRIYIHASERHDLSMKLWTGRYKGESDRRMDELNSSIRFDKRLYYEDIEGSIAHAKMLSACGILDETQMQFLVEGLETLRSEITDGSVEIPDTYEDIHSFVEAELTKRIGEVGKRLHTARSRNDQVATDFKLFLRGQMKTILSKLSELALTLCDLAEQNTHTVMPGYTHLQRAQPITYGHYLMAYVQMLLRDIGRLADAFKRADECPLGSGALAGTTFDIDRELTARLLGFAKPMENSLDGVSDRDFALEFLSCLSIIMVHLSRFAEEIILWTAHEFYFIELDEAFATGSSIMPQKKNPDVAELVRGKAGRVIGALTALLVVMKGLPLAYNKDMQEDKEGVFDASDTVLLCLEALTPMCRSLKVNAEKMRRAAAEGFINATDCADYLTGKGVAFRDAYKITGEIVKYCQEKNLTLETLEISEYRDFSPHFDADIYEKIALETCVEGRKSMGGPSPSEVERQIKNARKRLSQLGKAEI